MKDGPVIHEKKFTGSDVGLTLPTRQLALSGFALQITNLDRMDPPKYLPNGVPRETAFNNNDYVISHIPEMPKINVACSTTGFTPGPTSPLFWRLQSLQVLGRFMRKGPKGHYVSKVVRLAGEWTGKTSAAKFTLFDAKSRPVVYDNLDGRVCGGHAVLTVAYRPAPKGPWLQDFVHLRITGENPTEANIRDEVTAIVNGRGAAPLEQMLDAIFAWEANFQQFASSRQTSASYHGVGFDWPDDPPGFPVAAFDFGVGLSQYTHPSDLTTAIAWDWRQNLKAGANIFFDKLESTYKPELTWKQWALAAWERYNGSGSDAVTYAKRLAGSPDGELVPKTKVPAKLDLAKALARVEFHDPPPGKWPLNLYDNATIANAELAVAADLAAAEELATAAALVAGDRQTLAWMWPQLVRDLHGRRNHAATHVLPGVNAGDLSAMIAGKKGTAINTFAEQAFDIAWNKLREKRPSALRAIAHKAEISSVADEWRQLIPSVRNNIGKGTLAEFADIRLLLFTYFGTAKKPSLAIERINAYYGAFVGTVFLPNGSTMKLHAAMESRLNSTLDLLKTKGEQGKLSKVKSIGGFNIRRNANSNKKLSNHSFGVACDLDPPLNPNLPFSSAERKRWDELVEFLTGVSPYGGESSRLHTPRSFNNSINDVRTLCQASANFVAANQSLNNLADAVRLGVARLSGVQIAAGEAAHLLSQAAPPHPNRGAVKVTLIDLGVTASKADKIADRIVYARKVFALTQDPGLKPEIAGNAATTAKFGFISLPAEVIAALVASDGGKLRWLGTAAVTKDYMHFDFRDEERPPPY